MALKGRARGWEAEQRHDRQRDNRVNAACLITRPAPTRWPFRPHHRPRLGLQLKFNVRSVATRRTLLSSPHVPRHLSVTESVVLPPSEREYLMPDAPLTNKLSPSQVAHPRCPACEARMDILRIVPGRPGFEHRTLRCSKCGVIYEAQAPADPIDAEALGWLRSGLNPPQ